MENAAEPEVLLIKKHYNAIIGLNAGSPSHSLPSF